jgi:hypothetical protein
MRRPCLVLIVLTTLSLLVAANAAAEPLVLQPGPADGKDSFVFANNPAENNGSQTILRFGGYAGGAIWLYIQFDLVGLDETSDVESAQLELYMTVQNGFINGFTYSLMRVTAPWNESTLCWSNKPDHDPEVLAVINGNDWQAQMFQWHVVDGLGDLVQFWLEHPDQNHGLVIKPTSSFYGYPEFWSSDYATASLRPKLVIDGQLVPTAETSFGAVKALY